MFGRTSPGGTPSLGSFILALFIRSWLPRDRYNQARTLLCKVDFERSANALPADQWRSHITPSNTVDQIPLCPCLFTNRDYSRVSAAVTLPDASATRLLLPASHNMIELMGCPLSEQGD